MTRIFELTNDEFVSVESGDEFIILKDDKTGIKQGDTLIFQTNGDTGDFRETHRSVHRTVVENIRKGYILCVFSQNGHD